MLNLFTGIFALLTLAPWGVYLAGLAKLTDVLSDWDYSQAVKQVTLMLEWYTVSAELLYIILIVIACFAKGLHRTHSMFGMFFAVNTGLIIIRATVRIIQINALNDNPDQCVVEGVTICGNNLSALRAQAAGMVATAGCNFVLAILFSFGGTSDLQRKPHAH